ncbi:hypothetical protein TRL7639_01560 [Falsiruegeria litorea R37]|uniref:Uncharacterized protein n=1 Tax=Falsiruegeria litorea R37 TaxID=1200284 RepID=A0A1Y5S7S6_9RHOB|nr:hypothetical protein TRL7639_01560 [Falsiruegeria litorea R37]
MSNETDALVNASVAAVAKESEADVLHRAKLRVSHFLNRLWHARHAPPMLATA